VAEGIDLVIGETFSFLGEALIALDRARQTGLPVIITMSFEAPDPRAYEGDSVADCARRLIDAGADVVGINCLRDPERTLPLAAAMRAAVPNAWIATQPAAFRVTEERPDFTSTPEFPFALEHLTLSRSEMGAYAMRARDVGVRYIGSCCGSVANHVRAMAKALGRVSADERTWRSTSDKAMSAYESYGHNEAEVPRA
jgi:betaine-homocysteine S-methyltransferase